MIECPQCGISFSPSLRVCPQCKSFRPRLEDRLEYLQRMAEESLEDGNSPGFVERSLVHEGLSPEAARKIVAARSRQVRRAARFRGIPRIVVGLILLAIAAALVFGGALVFRHSGSRFLLRGGLLLLFFVVPLLLWAIYNVIFGRD